MRNIYSKERVLRDKIVKIVSISLRVNSSQVKVSVIIYTTFSLSGFVSHICVVEVFLILRVLPPYILSIIIIIIVKAKGLKGKGEEKILVKQF